MSIIVSMIKSIKYNRLGQKIILFIFIFVFNFSKLLQGEATVSGEKFSLQAFVNSDQFMDYISGYTGDKFTLPHLFIAQKEDGSAFKNFNINEADQFILLYETKLIFFSRKLNLPYQEGSNHSIVNFTLNYYDIGLYPIDMALHEVIKTCGEADNVLWSISMNHPATWHSGMVYSFKFSNDNKNRDCNEHLFDTYHKKIFCFVMQTRCDFKID